jgi:KUP system potassium uptake protein
LITGSFTLVGEAMRLNFWYRQEINYPTDFKGQLYIPQVNWLLMMGCIGVVLYFQESRFMEAAYGLAVTMTMLMTTLLLSVYLRHKKYPLILIVLLTGTFLTIEISFLIANLKKFPEGGWITVLIGLLLISTMWLWFKGRQIRRSLTRFESTGRFFQTLKELSNDQTLPQYATHLVYLTESDSSKELEKETMLSILERTPKRADVYWFVHVITDDEPFTACYKVETLAKEDVYYMKLTLGFRIDQRINYFFELAIEDMQKNNEVTLTSRHPALKHYNIPGDVRFVLLSSFLSHENELPFKQHFIMRSYYFIRRWLSIREDEAYGLDASNVVIEKVPVVVREPKKVELTRET